MAPSVVRLNHLREAFTGQRSMGTKVIEVNELKSDLRCDLRGHLEAAMASHSAAEEIVG